MGPGISKQVYLYYLPAVNSNTFYFLKVIILEEKPYFYWQNGNYPANCDNNMFRTEKFIILKVIFEPNI